MPGREIGRFDGVQGRIGFDDLEQALLAITVVIAAANIRKSGELLYAGVPCFAREIEAALGPVEGALGLPVVHVEAVDLF